MSANRLSAQNYCTSCDSRKTLKGKTICLEYNRPVIESMKNCRLLKPFVVYKEFKN